MGTYALLSILLFIVYLVYDLIKYTHCHMRLKMFTNFFIT